MTNKISAYIRYLHAQSVSAHDLTVASNVLDGFAGWLESLSAEEKSTPDTREYHCVICKTHHKLPVAVDECYAKKKEK